MKPYKHIRDKGNPLVQRFMDAMEIVGARPDKSEISEQGNVHLSYAGTKYIVKPGVIAVCGHHGAVVKEYGPHDFCHMMNKAWKDTGLFSVFSQTISFPNDVTRWARVLIRAGYLHQHDLRQKLKLQLWDAFKANPINVYSFNPDHIAIARGYLLGDTPAEVVLEYLCEVCPQINEFVYPVGQ